MILSNSTLQSGYLRRDAGLERSAGRVKNQQGTFDIVMRKYIKALRTHGQKRNSILLRMAAEARHPRVHDKQ